MRSTSWATILLPFFVLATAAPADQTLATPVVTTKYFGPAQARPTKLPRAGNRASSGTYGGVTCHGSGLVAPPGPVIDAKDRYCNEYQGVVIPNGYQLYISYGYGDFKVDVGYWNIAGGNWIINWQECNDWLGEVFRECYWLTDKGTRGGYKSVSSGRVEIDPNYY